MSRSLLSVIWIGLLGFGGIPSVLTVEVTYNITVIPNPLEYCFVDSYILRRVNDTNTELIIVDDTGDWLVVNNGTDLLLLSKNLPDCEDDVYNPSIVICAVQVSMSCIVILSALCTIILHFRMKDLHNEFGLLVTIMCFFIFLTHLTTLVHSRYQFTSKANGVGYICAVLVYTKLSFIIFYHSTIITIYFHFAYLMYNTYKLRTVGPNLNGKLICKYVTFIVLLTIICMSLFIICDLMSNRIAFDTVDGYCAIHVKFINIRHVFSWLIPIGLLLLMIVTQLIIFGVGIILYFLVSRNLCALNTTDVRVCVTLVSTSGLHAILFFILFFSIKLKNNHSTIIPFLMTTVGMLVQQIILLIMLLKKSIVSEIKQYKNSCLYGYTHVCSTCIYIRLRAPDV